MGEEVKEVKGRGSKTGENSGWGRGSGGGGGEVERVRE